ncbi:hypothetical protein Tco_1283190 [Tanacetum coccineum]
MDYQCTQPSEEIDKIIQRTQERGIEICRQNEELNRVHEETMQILRKLIKIQDEKRIAIEKEAAELEAKRKSQECLNIEEKSIPQASIRSRKSRIDPTLSNFTVSTKRIPLSDFIPPVTPNVETVNSLSMGDKHLDTSKVRDPVPIPSESADLSDSESECDVPINDDSSKSQFTTFSNPLFDSNDDFSSDDESLSEEEIQKDEFKYFSNPLYDLDDEIITNEKILPNQKDLDVVIPIPPGIDERCSDLLESLLNRDSPIDSTKIDSIFDEFSLPRPPEESSSEYSDATIESLFPSPIPVEDRDIRFLEELLSNDSPPLPENESFSLDHFDDPSLPCPPPEPPDVEICFDFKPDAGVVTKKVVGDISEHDVFISIEM